MDEDRNRYIKFAIGVMFIVIVILLIFNFISKSIKKYNENNMTAVESIDNIDEYIIKDKIVTDTEVIESNLVNDYNTFYTLQTAFSNYISALMSGKYGETYSILTQDLKSKFDKKSYVDSITEYTKYNFGSKDAYNEYITDYNLKYLYLVKENVYIGEIQNINGELVKIGIVINSEDYTYRVFYVEI